MTPPFALRPAQLSDTGAIDRLLQRSYPRLLKADYPASVLVTALPRMTQANPGLLQSDRYYVAETPEGRLLGAGGWTMGRPGGAQAIAGRANMRHVVTDPDALRRGVGRAILTHSFTEARAAGATWMHCLATRTARAFYAAMGFETLGDISVQMAPGITFPAVEMRRDL